MGESIKTFKDLETWQKAHQLALSIYQITQSFPSEEKFGLISQIRRATISITANIAEGFGRYHFKDKLKFYYNSRGSLFEVQNFLLLSKDLSFLDPASHKKLYMASEEVARLLYGLIRSLEKQLP